MSSWGRLTHVNFSKAVLLTVLVCVFVLLFGTVANPSKAQSGEAYALIDAVNVLRTANGLPPYRISAELMASAQGHSDYQASISTITHTGAGGTRPRDRAIAAGYGGGATIFVSENIAGGTSLTVQSVVSMWQGDAPHLNTMLSPNYTDIGAGVATDGKVTYYTIDAGYIAGQGGGGTQDDGSQSSPAPDASQAAANPAAVAVIKPVLVASPKPDGSIVHVVESGQALILISKAYDVSLADILALNSLTQDSIIFPGEEILIKTADVTPSAAMTETSTSVPSTVSSAPVNSATKIPTRQVPAVTLPGATRVITPTVFVVEQGQGEAFQSSTILVIIGVLVAIGTALLVVGWSLKRGA